jgi:hypothetical protein
MRSHDIVDDATHSRDGGVVRLFEVERSVVRDLQRHLDQAVVDGEVVRDHLRGLCCATQRTRVDSRRLATLDPLCQPSRLLATG